MNYCWIIVYSFWLHSKWQLNSKYVVPTCESFSWNDVQAEKLWSSVHMSRPYFEITTTAWSTMIIPCIPNLEVFKEMLKQKFHLQMNEIQELQCIICAFSLSLFPPPLICYYTFLWAAQIWWSRNTASSFKRFQFVFFLCMVNIFTNFTLYMLSIVSIFRCHL